MSHLSKTEPAIEWDFTPHDQSGWDHRLRCGAEALADQWPEDVTVEVCIKRERTYVTLWSHSNSRFCPLITMERGTQDDDEAFLWRVEEAMHLIETSLRDA